MFAGSPVTDCVNAPVVVAPCGLQFVTGDDVVPQHIPRAESTTPPFDETLAPNVAVVLVTDEDVGVLIEGVVGVVKMSSDEYAVPPAFVAYPR